MEWFEAGKYWASFSPLQHQICFHFWVDDTWSSDLSTLSTDKCVVPFFHSCSHFGIHLSTVTPPLSPLRCFLLPWQWFHWRWLRQWSPCFVHCVTLWRSPERKSIHANGKQAPCTLCPNGSLHAEVAINNRKSLRTGPYITGDEPIGASIPYPEMVWLWICFSTWRMGISLSVKTYTINAVKTCRTCHLATVRWPSPLRWCSCRSQELQTISMTWATLRAADGMKAMLGCCSFAMITGVFMLSSSLLGICC